MSIITKLGFRDIFKKSRRQVNRENQEKGKRAERQIKAKWELSGYNVKRTGKGHDYKATKRDWLTGKKETTYIEVRQFKAVTTTERGKETTG